MSFLIGKHKRWYFKGGAINVQLPNDKVVQLIPKTNYYFKRAGAVVDLFMLVYKLKVFRNLE